MTQTSPSFSFDRFARQRFYTAANQRLLDLVSLGSGQTVVDLGCGTGAVTRLMLSTVDGLVVVAADPSAEMLEEAKTNLSDVAAKVIFVRAGAENISKHLPTKVDAVVFCSAIHLTNDKGKVMREISKVLRPGGRFAFNTTFYEGALPVSSLPFYKKVMLKSVRTLRKDYGVTHQRGERAEARQPLTPDEYQECLRKHNFQILHQEVVEMQMPFEAVQAIVEFDDFIAGALPGVPPALGSAALKKAAAEAFDELGMPWLPRNWLQIVAGKG
jgi:ubiquinone/menaquinone biosynthesis C-methylase UbiE